MKKRRRPPRDAAVFPSAPTLVISPSEILRRKTIAANRGPGKLPFRRDAFTDFLCAACGSHSALREKADEARGTRADYEQQLPRIDGINFAPRPDTRRGDRRKSRLKQSNVAGAHHQPILRPSPIALLTGAPKATNRS